MSSEPNMPALSVIVPAHNEAERIGACLSSVLASQGVPCAQIVVVANGCTDATAEIAQGFAKQVEARGWRLDVLERAEGNKLAALNAGDHASRAGLRAYLDADVEVSPELLAQSLEALSRQEPAYASGALTVAPPKSFATKAYARIYAQVPFITHGVPGAGFFAVNGAGRARWGEWPQIISDDTFARLSFKPEERYGVEAPYVWPLVEGWRALVKVRDRQNRGVAEIAVKYPELMDNDDKPALPLGAKLGMALRDPIGFGIYASVALATRVSRGSGWERGR